MMFLSDSFSASNMEMFTTFDNDNDKLRAKNCAVDMFSGWWYADTNSCTEANLNGVHWPQVVNDKRGVTWVKWLGTWTLKETRMMIRKPWYSYHIGSLSILFFCLLSLKCLFSLIFYRVVQCVYECFSLSLFHLSLLFLSLSFGVHNVASACVPVCFSVCPSVIHFLSFHNLSINHF